MYCDFPDDDYFYVYDMFSNRKIYKGQSLSFSITDIEISFTTYGTTPSWDMTVYNPDGYKIDRLKEGLSFSYDCEYPCQTCLYESGYYNPWLCESCNLVLGDYMVLYDY